MQTVFLGLIALFTGILAAEKVLQFFIGLGIGYSSRSNYSSGSSMPDWLVALLILIAVVAVFFFAVRAHLNKPL